MKKNQRKISDDPYGAFVMIRRLVTEQGVLYWKKYLASFVLLSITAAATAVSAYLLGQVVNKAYVEKDLNAILWISAAIVGIFIVKGLATYGSAVILSRIANQIFATNQIAAFNKLLTQNISYFSARHSSEFLNRVTAGSSAITGALSLVINALGRDMLTLVGLVSVMVWQDPVMSLFGLVIAPPALWSVRKLIKRIKAIAQSQFHNNSQIIEVMQETLQGMRTVKAFSLEETMRLRLAESVAAVQSFSNKMARVSNRSSPMMEMLGGFAVAGSLAYGGYRTIETGAAPGQFISFITAFLLAYEPAKRLARLNIELNGTLIGARMLLELIDTPASEPDDSDKPPLQLTNARVEMRDGIFSYRPNEIVIDGMNFTAEPGKVTALVGPSGGGKSTVLSLLLRLYHLDSGAILIDGQDITEVSRRSLRSQTAYVGQDVYLFRGTIRENIAFGKIGASEDEIVAAAKAAFAHDFIMHFPRGYDTPVGEHGAQLSGGQRQRVAIARALVRDAPIILLDEATAALDSESERLVKQAIDHLCANRTTIVIAHRLHTIMHADAILVVEGGKIVEQGRHDELLRRNQRYATFFRLQHHDASLVPEAAVI